MSSECDDWTKSTFPSFEYSESIEENSSNVQVERPEKIKLESTDNLDNTLSSIQSEFELSPLVEFKTERNVTSSAIELNVEEKIEIEEPLDYKNLLEIPLKTEFDQIDIDRASKLKIPETKTPDESQLLHCHDCGYVTKKKSHLKRHITGVHLKIHPHKCDICSFQGVQKLDLKRHKLTHFKKCRRCDYVGINQKALLAHRLANHSIKHKCRFCDYVTNVKSHLNAHENCIHLKKEQYFCPDCDYTALYKSNMTQHRQQNHEETYFNCDKCDYQTRVKGQLKRHTKMIHKKTYEELKIFHCEYCDYTSKRMDTLKRHINGVHLKNYPHKCDICSFRCLQKTALNHHKSTHFKKCEFCDYVGINQEALSTHRIANHNIYKCRFCDYVAKSNWYLNSHENGVHLKKEKHLCPDCNYTTLYKSKMVLHRRKKHEEIYFNCDKCDYQTKIQSHLRRHINTMHIGLYEESQKFHCEYCDYTSKRMDAVKRHINGVHLKNYPYKCDICNFRCLQKSALTHHKSIHNKKCEFCDYVGINREALSSHKIATHSRYKCQFCDYESKNKALMAKHENDTHPKELGGALT